MVDRLDMKTGPIESGLNEAGDINADEL